MISFLRRRIIRLVAILFPVTLLTFAIVNLLPGDPAVAILGDEATADQIESFRAEHGLDRPIPSRYVSWLGAVLTGDFGTSLRFRQDVLDVILQRFPVSLQLMVMTQIVALGLAMPLGMLGAYWEDSPFDRASTTAAFGLVAMPNFMLALLLIYVFPLGFGILPATGFVPLSESPWANLRSMALPVVTLAAAEVGVYQRLLRSDVLSTLREDFITLARAKGLSPHRILLVHTLRLSSFSIITLLGINVGRLLGGAVIVETIFALPGIGRLMIESILARDFFMLQGIVLFTAIVYVVANALVDILYGALDPRTRLASQ